MAHKLLVIDDEETILFAMKEYFTTRGFEVDLARDKQQATTALTSNRYDALIADLRLSGFSDAEGWEVVQYARERSPDTHIVILTAYGTSQIEQKAIELGVDSFLRKPKPLPDIAHILFGLLSDWPPPDKDPQPKM